MPERLFVRGLFVSAILAAEAAAQLPPEVEAAWRKPAIEYRPRMRWWWPGNALTESEIDRELQETHAQGIGGVEIISSWRAFSRGNATYLSPEWANRVRHDQRST